MFTRSGIRFYDFKPPAGISGAVFSGRPEIAMVRRGLGPKQGASTSLHEALHSAQATKQPPARVIDIATEPYQSHAVSSELGSGRAFELRLQDLASGSSGYGYANEGAAYALSRLIDKNPHVGEVLGRLNAGLITESEAQNAIKKAAMTAFGTEAEVQAMKDALSQKWRLSPLARRMRSETHLRQWSDIPQGMPQMGEEAADALATSLLDILSGRFANQNALVPTGVAEDVIRSRALPRVPIAPTNPAPYMQPFLKNVPRYREANPILAALLGYNALNQTLPQ
jgi:hypothetical protein